MSALLDDFDIIFIIGFFIILLSILFLVMFINKSTIEDYPEECEYLDVNKCNNGDIICVSYYSFSGAFISGSSNSIWSHTGFIWVDPDTNIRYVLEGAIYKPEKYKHFFKIPLKNWMHINRHMIMGYKKYHGEPINSEYMMSKFEWMMKECNLSSFDIFWARFLINKQHYNYSVSKRYTCLEGFVILGQEVGIFKKDKIYCSYLPGDVINDKINLCDGIKFSKVKQIFAYPTEKILLLEDQNFQKFFWKN